MSAKTERNKQIVTDFPTLIIAFRISVADTDNRFYWQTSTGKVFQGVVESSSVNVFKKRLDGSDEVIPTSVVRDLGIYINSDVLYEVTHHEDRLCLLRCAASATKHLPVHSNIRLPVAGDVSCPDATGLWKFHPCRHSARVDFCNAQSLCFMYDWAL